MSGAGGVGVGGGASAYANGVSSRPLGRRAIRLLQHFRSNEEENVSTRNEHRTQQAEPPLTVRTIAGQTTRNVYISDGIPELMSGMVPCQAGCKKETR